MKALVADGRGGFVVERVDDPTPRAGEVVVAVRASGICGSDLHILDGASSDASFPLIPGHEVAGEIVSTGTDVVGLLVGDRVAVDPSLYCMECRYCRNGKANVCDRRGALGVTVPGGFAEYAAVKQGNCHHLPDGMTFGLGALVEPMSCVVHGLDRLRVTPGSEALIVGGGSIGLMMLRGLLASGAASVSVVDPDPRRLSAARDFGCAEGAADASALIARRGRGYDYVVECAGVPAAVDTALRSADKGATVLLFGVPPEQAQVPIRPHEVYRHELTILGSMAVLNSYSRAVSLTHRDAETLSAILTHQYSLEDFSSAVEATKSRAGGKVQIVFDG